MNTTPPPLPTNMPPLDATCDRIVAALTRRLRETARQIEDVTPLYDHDFLIPVVHPDLAEPISRVSR
ncbi:hypothetical protein [Actomonas aquatica]|uniref:Uncharacterized protein n=1 Tax=Actomonas aquatica TaxID=2866162 RepID=A0ABZ1C4I9_9BACT|nr:hypothetical protein [Opitutus sp. WL0086]WRQ86636.1 hypothetical protein K1X11_017630 [Opitutus sp. WL0086]